MDASLPPYPLREVLQIKKRRVEEAEKILGEKKTQLKREEEKLAQAKKVRDAAEKTWQHSLLKLRQKMDKGTTPEKIQQRKRHLDKLKEEWQEKKEKVNVQKEEVKKAEKEVEAAREDLREKERGEEKIQTHREIWEKEIRKEQALLAAREEDEAGAIIFINNKRKREGK